MAISRSSALKINTQGWITFSMTISVWTEAQLAQQDPSCPAPLLATALTRSTHSPRLRVWVAREEPRIEARGAEEWKLKEGSETGWSAANNTPIKFNRTKAKWQYIISNATAKEKQTKDGANGLHKPLISWQWLIRENRSCWIFSNKIIMFYMSYQQGECLLEEQPPTRSTVWQISLT